MEIQYVVGSMVVGHNNVKSLHMLHEDLQA
jgi:hypothetical protein